METPASSILSFSVRTRLFVIILQFVSNILLPDHDADVFNPPMDSKQFTLMDSAVHWIFGGFRRWDAVYFTHIMQHGYSYENCIAFFPFFPWLVSFAAKILLHTGILQFSSCVLLTSVLVNFGLFVLASQGLYRLGKAVVKDDRVAYYAALFFCINPASIFMTAPYSEVLYFFTLIYALNGLQAGAKYAASFLIGLGVFTRSNGLIGTGFVLHSIVKSFFASVHKIHVLHQRSCSITYMREVITLGFKTAQEMLICILLCILPFFFFQYFTFLKFCQSPSEVMDPSIKNYGRQQGYHLQGDEPSSWCHNPLPLSYTYIQQHHWGVGFLQYYTWKQVPNFLLAVPIFCLSLRACYYFLNLDHKASMYLGLWDFRALALHRALMLKKVDSFEYDEDESRGSTQNVGLNSSENGDPKVEDLEIPPSLKQLPSVGDMVVFALHLLSLVIFGLMFVHIQVVTRLLCSSSPLLYWYCASLYTAHPAIRSHAINNGSDPAEPLGHVARLGVSVLVKLRMDFLVSVLCMWPRLSRELKFIFVYFITYLVVGTVIFSNFLPWT